MKLTFIMFVFFAMPFCSIGQSNLTEKQVAEYLELSDELSGTYQIQMIGTRSLPSFPIDLYPKIKNARNQNEISYLNVDAQMRILVLPYDVINAADFRPIKRITHINSYEK